MSTLVNELSIDLVWYLCARFVRSGGLRPFCRAPPVGDMAVFVFGASVWWNGKFAVGCCAWVLFVGPFGVRDVAAFVFDTSVWWNGKFAYRILCFIGYYTMLGSFLSS